MSSNLRITGLATGMDTESMVKSMMQVQRIPVDRIHAKKQVLSWKQEAFRAVNSKLLDLRTMMQDMRFSSNYNTTKITSSHEQFVKVANGGSTQAATHRLEVSKLASVGTTVGSSVNSTSSLGLTGTPLKMDAADPNVFTLDATNNSFAMELDGVSKTITLDAKTYSIGGDDDLIAALQTKINQAYGAGKVEVSINASNEISFTPSGYKPASGSEPEQLPPQLIVKNSDSSTLLDRLGFQNNQSYKVDSSMTLEQLDQKLGAGSITFNDQGNLTFTMNGVNISASKSDTIQSFMQKVNSSEAGVKMNFDVQSGIFSMVTKTTGSNSSISLQQSQNDSGLMQALGFHSDVNVSGSNAIFKLNGLETQRSSNDFTIDGISYTLLKETTDPITITSQQDTSSIFDKIKAFVNRYNEVIADIHSRLEEKTFREFQPLTDEQKKEMKEDEVKKWEEKAKSGLLRSESSILGSITSSMRRSLSEPVHALSGMKMLSEIGINTSKNFREHGKLEIDESKLREAIANNPDQVIDLFTIKVEGSDGKIDSSQSGLAQRLYDNLNLAIDQIGKKAGFANAKINVDNSTIGQEVSRLNNRLFGLEDRLKRKENNYFKQFAALEKAIGQMSAQSNWLMSQMGQGR
ncbi:flagellar filament capping protein FliD [Ammoniphilus sp. YIM 78166]|uniref:flagellar filament capping protein FliD n=1 Tax=Ammoniphilus sp. YIM 78166 TaxID=1644106 RepID=UPI00106F69AF|nr:flagellar filament capping protein FliD [Ammoniphilus sp. YIM 78166]